MRPRRAAAADPVKCRPKVPMGPPRVDSETRRQRVPLVQGTIRGGSIDCARHHYTFDVRTGENTFPLPIYPGWNRAQVGDLRVPIFPVIERDGWIAVEPTRTPI